MIKTTFINTQKQQYNYRSMSADLHWCLLSWAFFHMPYSLYEKNTPLLISCKILKRLMLCCSSGIVLSDNSTLHLKWTKLLLHPAVNINTHFTFYSLSVLFPQGICFLLSICIRSSLIRLLDLWGGLSETWPRLWMLLKSASQSPEPCFTAILQRRGVCSPLQHFFVILQMTHRYTPVAQVCFHQKVIPVPFRAFIGPVTQSTGGGVSKLIRHRSDR